MFVPTHKKIDLESLTPDFIIFIKEHPTREMHYIGNDGTCDWMSKHAVDKWYKPIIIPCPYCNTDIQQQERVECECGWVACAMPLEVVTHGLSLDVDGMHCDTDCSENPTYLRYGIFNDDDTSTWMVTIRFIGGFNWLEIKAGKEN